MDTDVTMTGNQSQHQPGAFKQLGLGKRLRATRESLDLSEKDAAARLHLNVKMIPIMENEDFENGPPATFMRGYLRSYARMLNISDDEVNHAISQLETAIPRTPEPCSPPILNTRSKINPSYRYLRLMTYVVISVLVLLVGMWWSSHSKEFKFSLKSSAANANTPAPAVIPVEPPQSAAEQNDVVIPAAIEPKAPPVVTNKNPVTPPPAVANPAPAASNPAPAATPVTPPVAQAPAAPENEDDLGMALSDPALDNNEN